MGDDECVQSVRSSQRRNTANKWTTKRILAVYQKRGCVRRRCIRRRSRCRPWQYNCDRLLMPLYKSHIQHSCCCKSYSCTIRACYGHFIHLHLKMPYTSTSCINILYLCIAINRQPNAGKLRGERRDVREKTFDGCIPDYQSCSWFRAVHGVSLYDAGMNCMSPQKVALRHDLYLHCLYPRTIPATPLKEAQYHQ